MSPADTSACRCCGAHALVRFVEVADVPVHVGRVWHDPEAARTCPRGDMRMVFCAECGFIANGAFRPELAGYDIEYENALHASALFRAFEDDLVDQLIRRYDLEGRHVLEIGCGDGHFLALLCHRAGGFGTGYDPSHDPDRADPLVDDRVTVHRRPFSADTFDVPFDLLCARQVLEHLADPHELIETIAAALRKRPEAGAYLDVPNALLALRDQSIWDLMYEHCSYFTVPSLRRLFALHDLEALRLDEAYEGQFLAAEVRSQRREAASPTDGADPHAVAELAALVAEFGAVFERRRASWQERLADDTDKRRIAAWGGGARAVGFFNMIGIDEEIPLVVDINPKKQGTFLAGTGQPIVAPGALLEFRPDVVVVINPIYVDEVRAALHELGLDPEVVAA